MTDSVPVAVPPSVTGEVARAVRAACTGLRGVDDAELAAAMTAAAPALIHWLVNEALTVDAVAETIATRFVPEAEPTPGFRWSQVTADPDDDAAWEAAAAASMQAVPMAERVQRQVWKTVPAADGGMSITGVTCQELAETVVAGLRDTLSCTTESHSRTGRADTCIDPQ